MYKSFGKTSRRF